MVVFGIPPALPTTCAIIWNGDEPTSVACGAPPYATEVGGPFAEAIDSFGNVVGAYSNKLGPFYWNPIDNVPVTLEVGTYYGSANGLNDLGAIVGYSYPNDPTDPPSPTLWSSASSNYIILPTLTKVTHGSSASGINADGVIVGTSFGEYPTSLATMWQGSNVTDLGTLGGKSSAAAAISSFSRIVGWADTKSGAAHAASWYRGKATDLGTLGGRNSYADAINKFADIVGASQHVGCCTYHAVIWPHETRRPIDLNQEISASDAKHFVLVGAAGINDHCVIVANGYDKKSFADESFVLTLKNSSKNGSCNPKGARAASDDLGAGAD